MPGVPDPADPVWDDFHRFLEKGDVPANGQEADAELRKIGIDPGRVRARVMAAVKKARAREELEAAKRWAAAAQEQIAAIPSSVERMNRERLKELIAERCDQASQMTYFRKLDAASTETDLRAILEDLDCLNHIVGGRDNGGEPGQPTPG